jgi:hypothetical protein
VHIRGDDVIVLAISAISEKPAGSPFGCVDKSESWTGFLRWIVYMVIALLFG